MSRAIAIRPRKLTRHELRRRARRRDAQARTDDDRTSVKQEDQQVSTKSSGHDGGGGAPHDGNRLHDVALVSLDQKRTCGRHRKDHVKPAQHDRRPKCPPERRACQGDEASDQGHDDGCNELVGTEEVADPRRQSPLLNNPIAAPEPSTSSAKKIHRKRGMGAIRQGRNVESIPSSPPESHPVIGGSPCHRSGNVADPSGRASLLTTPRLTDQEMQISQIQRRRRQRKAVPPIRQRAAATPVQIQHDCRTQHATTRQREQRQIQDLHLNPAKLATVGQATGGESHQHEQDVGQHQLA